MNGEVGEIAPQLRRILLLALSLLDWAAAEK